MDLDNADWERILNKYGPALLLYARQWSNSAADAEDAVQEGFIRVLRGKRRYKKKDVVPILFTAVKRAAVDDLRRKTRRRAREEKSLLFEDDDTAMFVKAVDRNERREEMELAMKALPAEQREVIVMKIWGEMTFEAIADALGISPNTAASRYRYALVALRRQIDGSIRARSAGHGI